MIVQIPAVIVAHTVGVAVAPQEEDKAVVVIVDKEAKVAEEVKTMA
jgi:hypothetical protein